MEPASRLVQECLSALRLSDATGEPRLDEDKAQELFAALRVEGEALHFRAIRLLALESGWPDAQAMRLAELAQRVSADRPAPTWNHGNWALSIVAMIKGELERAKH